MAAEGGGKDRILAAKITRWRHNASDDCSRSKLWFAFNLLFNRILISKDCSCWYRVMTGKIGNYVCIVSVTPSGVVSPQGKLTTSRVLHRQCTGTNDWSLNVHFELGSGVIDYLLQYWTGTVDPGIKVNSRHRSMNIMFMTGNTGSQGNKFELNYKSTPRKLYDNVLKLHNVIFNKFNVRFAIKYV